MAALHRGHGSNGAMGGHGGGADAGGHGRAWKLRADSVAMCPGLVRWSARGGEGPRRDAARNGWRPLAGGQPTAGWVISWHEVETPAAYVKHPPGFVPKAVKTSNNDSI